MALAAATVVLVVFGARLFQIQGVDAEVIAAQALENRSASTRLPAQRGDILDSTGAVLATSVQRRHITVDQTVVTEYNKKATKLPAAQRGISGAALVLAPVLGLSRAQIEEKLTGTRRFVYLAKDVEPRIWTEVDRKDIPGILSEVTSRRMYPNGQVAASLIGFLGKDGTPLSGLERGRNQLLQGVDGERRYERGAGGQAIATGRTTRVDPVPGRDLQLTIDRDLQWVTQQALDKQLRATKAKSGAAVVLDTRTWEVLALADAPTFDPNTPGTASARDRENRALTDVFEPGSTSKVITAAAAIEEGKATPRTRLSVDDTIARGRTTFHDSHSHATEKLTLAGVLAQSSNVGTIKIGERMSSTVLRDYMARFGYGQRTGVGLPESPGILTKVDDYSASTPYTVMFGHGVSVTALQAASVFATIANDGVRGTPRVVKAIGDGQGNLRPQPAGPTTRAVSAKTARQLRLTLESVVSNQGTAVKASIPGYRVAGKTGTADYFEDRCRCYEGYTGSFIGMAPADDPRLVVAVFLQKPSRNYYGGTVAAPVFQQVMKDALARMGIAPSGQKAPGVPLDWH